MTSILFICLGNICRSCTAEEIFRTLADKTSSHNHYHVDSAGIIDYHEGELPDARMRHHAQQHGYHLTHHSRPVTTDDFHKFDLIVAMDERNREKLLRLAPQGTDHKVIMMADYLQSHPDYDIIPDPYYGDARDFELVIDLLEDACSHLLERLEAGASE